MNPAWYLKVAASATAAAGSTSSTRSRAGPNLPRRQVLPDIVARRARAYYNCTIIVLYGYRSPAHARVHVCEAYYNYCIYY